jgi:hypothetical protein
MKRFCEDAPELIPVFLDGVIWRSRLSINGLRRVNFFIKVTASS